VVEGIETLWRLILKARRYQFSSPDRDREGREEGEVDF
jgi:hypothetical protein